jgi:hypothetical protein
LALFHAQQAFYKMKIGVTNHTIDAHFTLTLGRFFGEDVALKRFLERDLTRTGYFEPLFGAAVGFNLWHFK